MRGFVNWLNGLSECAFNKLCTYIMVTLSTAIVIGIIWFHFFRH